MNENTHTPKPWLVADSEPFVYALNSAGTNRFWCSVQGGCYPSHHGGTPTQADELLANARLIAAAPDLLAALRGFANLAEYREIREAMASCLRPHERAGFLADMEAARAAVAKAEGKPC